jgi:hypothetical protein
MADQETTPAFDAADGSLDDFKKAVEAAAKGEIEAPKPEDDDTGKETGKEADAEGGEAEEVVEETAEEKAAKEAAVKEAAAKAAAAGKPRKSVSERIAEFRRSLTDAQEVAQIEAAEAERLRLENEALKKRLETPANGKPAKVAYVRADGEPDPAKYEFGVIDPAYQRDLTKFFVEADRKAAETASAEASEAETSQKKFLDTVAKGLEKYDDYLQVVVQGADTGKWRLTPVAAQTIVDSEEFGHEIAYHLAKNPDEAAAIAELPPHRQAAAIGRLEARFAAEAEASTAETGEEGDGGGANDEPVKKPKNATGAPKPPARTSERSGGGEFKASPDTQDLNAYRRLVEKHQQGR